MSTTAQRGRAAGFSIAHITDTHLGAEHRDFEPNFLALIDEMKRVAPDLIINTGDLTVNGTEEDADHQRAYELHQRFTSEWRVLPGNHDIGDNPRVPGEALNKPVTAQRRDRYCAIWGADFWGTDAGEFRLIGLNAQLCGSDLAEEADQWDFLAQEVQALKGRPLALFLHKPLFLAHPDEPELTHRYVPFAPRKRLLDLLSTARLRLVATGHMHQHRMMQVGPVLHAWGPSSAFVLPQGFQPTIGNKQIGYNLYHLDGDRVTAQVCTPSILANNDLIDFPAPYGSVRDIIAGRAVYRP